MKPFERSRKRGSLALASFFLSLTLKKKQKTNRLRGGLLVDLSKVTHVYPILKPDRLKPDRPISRGKRSRPSRANTPCCLIRGWHSDRHRSLANTHLIARALHDCRRRPTEFVVDDDSVGRRLVTRLARHPLGWLGLLADPCAFTRASQSWPFAHSGVALGCRASV